MNSVGKNSIYNTIYTTINLLFPLLMSMYVARVLYSDLIGRVEYTRNIVSYFVTFAMLGLPSYGVREISRARISTQKTNKVFTELFLINLFTTCFSFLLYYFISPRLIENLDYKLLSICSISILLNAVNIDWFYQGMEEYKYILLRNVSIKLITFVLVVLFVKTTDDYLIYALSLTFSLGINHFLNFFHARKYVHFTFVELNIRQHISSLLILAISIFFSSFYHKLDITMLGIISTENSVAYYSYAHKIISVAISVCTAISSAFYPRLSFYYKVDREKFNNLLDFGVKIITFLSLPITVGVFMLAPEGIQIIFGMDFLPAVSTVRCLALIIPISSFGNLLSYQLILCTGNERKRLPAYIVSCIGNVILNAILIPFFYQNGAAFASVITELIVNGIQIYFMKKIVFIPLDKKILFQSLFSSVFMGTVIYFIKKIELGILISTIMSVLFGIIVYFGLNLILKNSFLMVSIESIKDKLNIERNK